MPPTRRAPQIRLRVSRLGRSLDDQHAPRRADQGPSGLLAVTFSAARSALASLANDRLMNPAVRGLDHSEILVADPSVQGTTTVQTVVVLLNGGR
jgi:hypothetical protein